MSESTLVKILHCWKSHVAAEICVGEKREKLVVLAPHTLVVQLVVSLTVNPGVWSLIPAWSHTFVEMDHEIISTVILLLILIQKGLLSVTSESMCTMYWLTACKLAHEKSVVRLTDRLDMTIAVDWDVKPQTNQIKHLQHVTTASWQPLLI